MKTTLMIGVAMLATAAFPTMASAATSRASFAYSGGSGQSVVLLINNSVSITARSRGWITDAGFSNFGASDGNYIVGICGTSDVCDGDDRVRNNWFVFDLTGIDPVTSAELQLSQVDDADGTSGQDGYLSTEAFETYTLWDTDESGASLPDAFGTALFEDLQSGTSFGNVSIDASTIGGTVTLAFNSAGITALNDNAGGLYGFGGSLGLAVPDAIPEPGSWALLIAGFGLTGAAMRRRRALAAA